METSECILTRRSIRKYLTTKVPLDKVGEIVKAGKAAPSAGNLQDWKFILIMDDEKRKQIAEASLQQHWMADAPVHIIVCALHEKTKRFYGERGEKLYAIQNCAAAVQNMLLRAHDLGLGACWVGAFEENMIREIASIPAFASPQAIIPIGYPDEKPPIPVKDTFEIVTSVERYGTRIRSIDHFMTKWGPGNRARVQRTRKAISDRKKKVLQKLKEFSKKQ